MDTTIDQFQSDETQQFLRHFLPRIQKGDLQVFIHESGQKYYQLGLDKLNGGIIQIHTIHQNFINHFKKITNEQPNDRLNEQVFTHFYLNLRGLYKEIRKSIFKNASYLEGKINKKFFQPKPDGQEQLFFAKSTDPYTFFLQLLTTTHDAELIRIAANLFRNRFQANGLVFIKRPSFGYNLLNYLSARYIRYSIGLESEEMIDKIADVLNKAVTDFNLGLKVLNKYRKHIGEEEYQKLKSPFLQDWMANPDLNRVPEMLFKRAI